MHLQSLGLLGLSHRLLERRNGSVNVVPVGVSNRDTHVAETDVLGGNLLVQTGCEDDATLQQTGEHIRGQETVRQVDGGHAVGLVLWLSSELGQAQFRDSSLDAVRGLGVDGETLGQRAGGDLGESGVEGVDELGRRGGEVRGLEVLVVLHDGDPVGHGGVVGSRRGGAGAETVNGARGAHDDAETGWAADGLLAGSHNDIEVPLVESDLFATDTADTVHDDEGLGAHAAHELRDTLDVAEDTSGGVDVGDGQELVGLLLESLFDLLERGTVPDRCLELGGVGAVGLQASSERVGKVTGVEDERILTLLDQVGGHHIPAQGATAGDDEGLSGGVGGLEKFANEGQGFSKGLDEAGGSVRLAADSLHPLVEFFSLAP